MPYIILSVCLCARISHEPHVQTSKNFLCTFPVTHGVAICYVVPVMPIMFANNRPGKSDDNRASMQSESQGKEH